MPIGGYGFAITVAVTAGRSGSASWSALGAAVVFALILGIPTLRLRADYLAIVTIAAAEIMRLAVIRNVTRPVTRRGDGLHHVRRRLLRRNPVPASHYGLGQLRRPQRATLGAIVGWILVAIACLSSVLLMRSPWGRVLQGIREDEDAVRSLGKNVYGYKMQSLIIGGVFGASAGSSSQSPSRSVPPDTSAPTRRSSLYTILLLGGAATVFGPVLGSIIFWVILAFTDNILHEALGAGDHPPLSDRAADSRPGADHPGRHRALMLLVFRPAGHLGQRRSCARRPTLRQSLDVPAADSVNDRARTENGIDRRRTATGALAAVSRSGRPKVDPILVVDHIHQDVRRHDRGRGRSPRGAARHHHRR